MTAEASYFVAGGTVPPGSPSYVERAADRELYEALLNCEYCYVLNSRQMGKSSLAVRTVERLQAAGVKTAFVDLTRIGGANVSAEQWYSGLLAETGRVLGLRQQATEFLKAQREFGPAQRFLAFLQEVVLEGVEGHLVVMIDEIDAIRSLSFSTDELFAGIRQLHNGRASEPSLRKLTFCLLGAALPSDLIRDPRTTPFNVGRRIELKDFTEHEAKAFARGLLASSAEDIVKRVLYWTGGHPFLTQTLCSSLAPDASVSVDQLVNERYLDARAKESDTNLADVGNRMLGRGDPNFGDLDRANTLSLYSKLLKAGIPDDESNPNCARIKMSGVARLDAGRLTVRNRIYTRVFGPSWVRENMPGQELRRQRKAFWKGALRTGLASAAVVAIVSTLAVIAVRNATRARELERAARYDAYAATMRNMNELRSQHNLMAISQAMDNLKGDPWRGWEWSFWNRFSHREESRFDPGKYDSGNLMLSPDRNLGLEGGPQGLGIFAIPTGRLVTEIPIRMAATHWFRDSRRLLCLGLDGTILVVDAVTGMVLKHRPPSGLSPIYNTQGFVTLAGDREALWPDQHSGLDRIDLNSLAVSPFRVGDGETVAANGGIALDGRISVWVQQSAKGSVRVILVADPDTGRIVRTIDVGEDVTAIVLHPNGHSAAVGTVTGAIRIVNVLTGRLGPPVKTSLGLINFLAFSPDGNRLGATGRTREGVLYKLEKGSLVEQERFDDSNDIGFFGDGAHLYTMYDIVRVYRIDKAPASQSIQVSGLTLGQGFSKISKDGVLYAATSAGQVELQLDGNRRSHPTVSPLGFPCDEGRVTVRWAKGRLKAFDTNNGRILREIPFPFWQVSYASANGKYLATRPNLDVIDLYHLDNNLPPTTLKFDCPVTFARFSGDARMLAVALSNGVVELYRVDQTTRLWAEASQRFNIVDFEFSPDGQKLAGCGNSDRGYVWDLTTGRLLVTLTGHAQSVYSITWSPDGQRLATGGDDTTIRLWDSQNGANLGIIGSHKAAIMNVRFLPGGRTLVSFSADGVAKFWMTEAQL